MSDAYAAMPDVAWQMPQQQERPVKGRVLDKKESLF